MITPGLRPTLTADNAFRSLRIVHLILIASMLMYMWLPSYLRVHPRQPLNPVLYGALVVMALLFVGVIVVVRNLLLQRWWSNWHRVQMTVASFEDGTKAISLSFASVKPSSFTDLS